MVLYESFWFFVMLVTNTYMSVPLTGCHSYILIFRTHAQTSFAYHYRYYYGCYYYTNLCCASLSTALIRDSPLGGGYLGLFAAVGGLVSSFVIYFFYLHIACVPLFWCVCHNHTELYLRVILQTTLVLWFLYNFLYTYPKNSIREVCDPAFQISGLRKLSQIKG